MAGERAILSIEERLEMFRAINSFEYEGLSLQLVDLMVKFVEEYECSSDNVRRDQGLMEFQAVSEKLKELS